MRNKIYVTNEMPHEQQEQCCNIDVGKVIANDYKNNPMVFEKESKFDAFYYFRQIIDSIIEPNNTRIVFTNWGILLEKDFSLDVPKFLLEYAKDYQVFILQGPFKIIDGNKIFFYCKSYNKKSELLKNQIQLLQQARDKLLPRLMSGEMEVQRVKLFIIGNGFDLEHNLPTHFKNNFKSIAEENEQTTDFWDIYQSSNSDIWSDFENCLAHPDFNELEKIFRGYEPDFSSDYERDRNAIITQVDLNGRLEESLYDFANQAEQEIVNKKALPEFSRYFNHDDLFVSFNYTHTLEELYKITSNRILHIHGEVGKDNLLLGYPEGEFQPDLYYYDPFEKGCIISIDFQEYVQRMIEDESIDYYTREAYSDLFEKAKSFYKTIQLNKLNDFLQVKELEEIIIRGHSCGIVDYKYFEELHKKYPAIKWTFYYYDEETKCKIEAMIKTLGIKKVNIKHNEDL